MLLVSQQLIVSFLKSIHMARNDQLLNLLRTNSVSRFLYRHARNDYVGALRRLLNELGYGQELNWDRLGADTFFGEETVMAVRTFSRRNNAFTDGATVSPPLVQQMIYLDEARSGLELMRRALEADRINEAFIPMDPNHFGTQRLVPVLQALQIPFHDVPDGLVKFARKQGLRNVTGARLTNSLARAMMAELRDRFGPARVLDPNLPDPNEEPSPPIEPKPVTELKVIDSGSSVIVSDGDQQVQFRKRDQGVVTFGYHTVSNFVNTNRQKLLQADIVPQGIEVIEAVSRNEGRMDGINTYDRGVVSLGVYQWTLGSRDGEGELPAMLKKVKSAYPRTFRTFFENYGIDVSDDTNTTYGYLTFEGDKVFTQEQKNTFRVPEWAFRFWRAAQEPDVQTIQVKHALSRLKNFYWHPDYAAHGFTLNEIITSSYGVALLLDNHVNRPAWVGRCVERAMGNIGLTSNPQGWSSAEERRLLDEYLRVRETYSENNYPPMTKADIRAQKIAASLQTGELSAERLSFRVRQAQIRSYSAPVGDKFTARSVAPATPGVAPPEDFAQDDYPIIKMDVIR